MSEISAKKVKMLEDITHDQFATLTTNFYWLETYIRYMLLLNSFKGFRIYNTLA